MTFSFAFVTRACPERSRMGVRLVFPQRPTVRTLTNPNQWAYHKEFDSAADAKTLKQHDHESMERTSKKKPRKTAVLKKEHHNMFGFQS